MPTIEALNGPLDTFDLGTVLHARMLRANPRHVFER